MILPAVQKWWISFFNRYRHDALKSAALIVVLECFLLWLPIEAIGGLITGFAALFIGVVIYPRQKMVDCRVELFRDRRQASGKLIESSNGVVTAFQGYRAPDRSTDVAYVRGVFDALAKQQSATTEATMISSPALTPQLFKVYSLYSTVIGIAAQRARASLESGVDYSSAIADEIFNAYLENSAEITSAISETIALLERTSFHSNPLEAT